MSNKKIVRTLLPILVAALLIPAAAYAQSLYNPLGTSDLRVVAGRVIKAMLGLSGALSLVMFMWGGFEFLTSQGDAAKIKKGKDTLIWATLGLALIFTAYTIVNALINALTIGAVE